MCSYGFKENRISFKENLYSWTYPLLYGWMDKWYIFVMQWVNDLWTILGLGSIGEMCKTLVWWGFVLKVFQLMLCCESLMWKWLLTLNVIFSRLLELEQWSPMNIILFWYFVTYCAAASSRLFLSHIITHLIIIVSLDLSVILKALL